MAWFSDLTLGTGIGEFENIAFEVVTSEVSLDVGIEFVKLRISSKWYIMDFTETFCTKCRVVRDKDAKGCFTCNDKIMMECKARMILSIAELLIERCKACVSLVCLVERIKQFSMRLRGRLELTEFHSCEVIGNSVDVCSEAAEGIGDNVCFARLVFDFEIVCLDRKDLTNNTISSGGGCHRTLLAF